MVCYLFTACLLFIFESTCQWDRKKEASRSSPFFFLFLFLFLVYIQMGTLFSREKAREWWREKKRKCFDDLIRLIPKTLKRFYLNLISKFKKQRKDCQRSRYDREEQVLCGLFIHLSFGLYVLFIYSKN